jgi:hypothetical protein
MHAGRATDRSLPNGPAVARSSSVRVSTNTENHLLHPNTDMNTALNIQRMTAAAMRRLERLLFLEPGERPRPVNGPARSPAACPSSTTEIATAEVALDDGGTRPAGRCLERRCGHWSGGCSLGAAVATVGVRMRELGATVPGNCAISAECRWLAENGPSACVLCPNLRRADIRELVLAAEVVAR